MTKIDLGVQAETQQAKKDLNDVVTAINEVKSAIDGLKSSTGLDKVKQSVKSVSDEVKKTRPSFSQFQSALKGMDFPLKNFGKSLMRIAKLRLLRGIIRSITGAFKEGLGNIYQYSAALNNMDSSHMKGTLDGIASSLLYMKNSVAAAVAPMIASLLPTIQKVTGWFVTAANAVAQFFAALGGASTFTRAKKTTTEFAKAANTAAGAAGGAAEAVEEYKNTILGFDEIHALNDVPSHGGGGGGGGGGIATPDYSSMFEEAPISQKIKDLVKWVQDHMNDILDIAKAIGAVLLTWRIARGLMDALNSLGWGKAAKAIQFLAGATISIVGFQLAYSGGYDIGYEGPDLMNIIKAGLGVALGGIGGAMIATAVGASGIIGFTIGAAISLVIMSIGYQMGQYEKLMDTTYRTTQGFDEVQRKLGEVDVAMKNNGTFTQQVADVWKDYGDKVAKIEEARLLIGYIDELTAKTQLTSSEQTQLQYYVEQLNGLGLPGITAAYDNLTGSVDISSEAMLNNLDTMVEVAKQEAYLEILKDAWKAEAQATLDAQMELNNFKDANQNAQDIVATMNKYLEDNYGLTNSVSWAYGDAGMNLTTMAGNILQTDSNFMVLANALQDQIDLANSSGEAWSAEQTELANARRGAEQAEEAYRQLAEGVDVGTDAVQLNIGELGYADTQLKGVADSLRGTAQDYSTYGIKSSDGLKNVKKTADNSKSSIDGMKKSADKLNQTSFPLTNIKDPLLDVNTRASNASSAVSSLKTQMKRLDGTTASIYITQYANVIRQKSNGGFLGGYANGGFIPGFANGGFVSIPAYASGGSGIDSASLFMAHENSAPELVGRIGNHTAVANTSQMVDAMSQGVYRAMSELMSTNQGQTEVNVYMDGQRIARAVDNANRVKNRRFNVQA